MGAGMTVPLVQLHEWIETGLLRCEVRLQFRTNGRPGMGVPGELEHDVDCMAGIKAILEAVNNDQKVFHHLRAKGVVE
jgi:hypothetical protein